MSDRQKGGCKYEYESISLADGGRLAAADQRRECLSQRCQSGDIYLVYVGADDGYVHRIYSVIALAQSAPSQPGLRITTLTDFSSFNQISAITAPQIGS
jgi:hypothetical protein